MQKKSVLFLILFAFCVFSCTDTHTGVQVPKEARGIRIPGAKVAGGVELSQCGYWKPCILQFSAGAASPPNPRAIPLASKLRYLKERPVVSPFDYLTSKTMVSKKLDFPGILRRVPQEKPGSAWCQPEEAFVSRKQSLSVLNSSDHHAESRDWSADKEERTTPCPGPPRYAYLLPRI